MSTRLVWALTPAALLFATLTACTAVSPTGDASASALQIVPCPGAVDARLVVPHDCMRLTTRESMSSARQVELFVLRLKPSTAPRADPLLILGSDLGDAPDYAGYGPAPNRVHRVVYVLDPRGSGYSQPSLSCPEADGIAAGAADESALLRDAARRCRERLEASGIDVAAYGPTGVARDAEALRRELGVETWNVQTLGTVSAYVPAVLATDRGSVRSVVIDSPYSPLAGTDETRRAWAVLIAECARDQTCVKAHPKAASMWDRLAVRLASAPLSVDTGHGAAHVDVAVLSRFIRSMLGGEGPTAPGRLLDDLASMMVGRAPDDLVHRLSNDGPCFGYRPVCPARTFSLGTYLAATCSSDLVTPSPIADSPPAVLDSGGPLVSACQGWPTASDTGDPTPDVPTLELRGDVDPFVSALPSERVNQHRFAVVVPGQTHNVLGYHECPLAIRNAWIDDPSSSPSTECLTDMPGIPFATP